MAFTLPTFNITANIWRNANYVIGVGPAGPPQVVTPANLSPGKRVVTNAGTSTPLMELLLPPRTDVRDGVAPAAAQDWVEAPAGTGRYYSVYYVDDVGRGFANEYRIVFMIVVAPRTYPLA